MKSFQQLAATFNQYVREREFDDSQFRIYAAVNYILSSEGKRFRPTLLMMAYNLYHDDIETVLPAALGIEVFHSFSLIHDDIMDEAAIRRGKPSVHNVYGVNQAILSGDAMMILSLQLLQESASKDLTPEIMKLMIKTALEVCEGQDLDMTFEDRDVISVDAYLHMIELKTAVLLAAALKMGVILANGSNEDADHLYEFGRQLGIAFQIQDDILDTFGDPGKVGKQIGGDILQKKKTFLITTAMEIMTDPDLSTLKEMMQSSFRLDSSHVETIKELLEKAFVKEAAINKQDFYFQSALNHLNQVDVEPAKKAVLQKTAQSLFQRDY